jgi:hypothetical protein
MTTQITSIDTNNYAAMAKAMGMSAEGGTEKAKSSTLARLRINHSPIMGTAEVKGKQVNMEVVAGGTYKLEIPDGPTYYAPSIRIRAHAQRFMYKRFIKGMGDKANRFVKTVMADNLNMDLKDNDGGFNCGKPAGFIKDFKALPEKTQALIKEIKRVRVVLGTVELIDPVDSTGTEVSVEETPFIWEIENRDAYKDVGLLFKKLHNMKRVPPMHHITATTEKRDLPNGNSFFLPAVSLDLTNSLELKDKEQSLFADFMGWVQNYNEYIINAWSDKVKPTDDSIDNIDEIVDISFDEDEIVV